MFNPTSLDAMLEPTFGPIYVSPSMGVNMEPRIGLQKRAPLGAVLGILAAIPVGPLVAAKFLLQERDFVEQRLEQLVEHQSL